MILQPIPPFDPSVLVASLSWTVISAVMLMYGIRMGDLLSLRLFWTLSFVGSSVIAVVVFWRLV